MSDKSVLTLSHQYVTGDANRYTVTCTRSTTRAHRRKKYMQKRRVVCVRQLPIRPPPPCTLVPRARMPEITFTFIYIFRTFPLSVVYLRATFGVCFCARSFASFTIFYFHPVWVCVGVHSASIAMYSPTFVSISLPSRCRTDYILYGVRCVSSKRLWPFSTHFMCTKERWSPFKCWTTAQHRAEFR